MQQEPYHYTAPRIEVAQSFNVNAQKLARVQKWLGTRTYGEYIGVESSTWSVDNFGHWVATVSPNAPDVAYVKTGEYGQAWYGGNLATIRELFVHAGIGFAPYHFCRPQFIESDARIAAAAGKLCGGVVLDCEEQWYNNNTQLYQLVQRVRQIMGPDPVLIVSGYGDPVTAVPWFDFGALHLCDAYQPQWYLGYWDIYHHKGYGTAIQWGDGQCYQQFMKYGLGADYPIQPACNVEGVGIADLAPITRMLLNWHASVTYWEARDITPEERGIIKQACKS